MVALPAVPSTAQVRFRGTIDASPWATIMHWRYGGGTPSSANLNTLCTTFGNAFMTSYGPYMTLDRRLMSVEVIDLAAADGAVGDATIDQAGSLTGTLLPASVACCITWRVNMRWRGGHPRNYLPLGSSGSLGTAQKWSAVAFLNPVNAATDAFLQAMNSAVSGSINGRLVCVRRYHTDVKGQPPISFDPPLTLDIVDNVVDSRIDTQRRRLGPDVAS